MDETIRPCPWCSALTPVDAKVCPRCGAALESGAAADIPGVTSVDPSATLGPPPAAIPNPIAWLRAGDEAVPGSDEAFQPPSEAVRLEMRRMELEAQIENAGTELVNPTGDESLDAGAPSPEAIVARESGLLDQTGPAGETDLADLAAPWEGPQEGAPGKA